MKNPLSRALSDVGTIRQDLFGCGDAGVDQWSLTEQMNPTGSTENTQALAHRLLAREAAAANGDPSACAALGVLEKVRVNLSTISGAAGHRAVLARALTLAKRQSAALHTIAVEPDGSLNGFEGLCGRDECTEAGAVLIGELLGLLDTFIGKNLLLRLLQDIWPDLPFDKEPDGAKQT